MGEGQRKVWVERGMKGVRYNHAMFDFYKLKNGVRVILVPMEGVESVGVGVYVETGSRHETPAINGISHFLEHMVFKGTAKFPTHQDTSYLEGLGAIQNAWTDVDATSYWTKIPSNHWEKGLELVKELALWPIIPERDLEIERGVILEEINRREDRPDEMAAEVMMESMFGSNPLGMTVLGTPEVIHSLKRQDFLDYHKRQYVAGRLVVAMAGRIDKSMPAIRQRIEEWFGGLPGSRGGGIVQVGEKQNGVRTKVKQKELAAQAHVELAVRGIGVGDPRRFALSLLTVYLGRGLSSRLFLELREKRGLCYAVRADEERWVDTGVWSVYAGVALDKLMPAVEAVWNEMKRMRQETLTEAELGSVKEKVRGPLLFAMENPIGQMDFYAKQALDRPEEILTYKQVIEKVMQIDAKEIQRVAQSMFLSQSINLGVVGPIGKKEEEQLQKILSVG